MELPRISGVRLLSNFHISGGGFGDIYEGEYNGKRVAIKRLRIRQDSDVDKLLQKFYREAAIWYRLEHTHILPFLGIDEQTFPRQPSMVSPWMQNGTLLQFLKNKPQSSTTLINRLLYETAQGLSYLHSQRVVHGDIKAENVLIDDRHCPRLCDFGLTKLLDESTGVTSTTREGTDRFMAPELLDPDRFKTKYQRTPESDVYAFACLCIQVYTQRPPFYGHYGTPILKVLKGKRPDRPSRMNDGLWSLVKICWSQDRSKRPTAERVVVKLKELEENVNSVQNVYDHTLVNWRTLQLPEEHLSREAEEARRLSDQIDEQLRIEAEQRQRNKYVQLEENVDSVRNVYDHTLVNWHTLQLPEEHLSREAEEARRVSDQIDKQLRIEAEQRKQNKYVQLLLLGQADSGKSTLLKQFQLIHTPNFFHQEHDYWRNVIYHNITRSVTQILGFLEENDLVEPREPVTMRLADLRDRLSALTIVKSLLADYIRGRSTVSNPMKHSNALPSNKKLLNFGDLVNQKAEVHGSSKAEQDSLTHDIALMLETLKEDIEQLWSHPSVRDLVSKRQLRLDEWSGFFLDNIRRVTATDYLPTTDDILRAKIRTVGIADQTFDLHVTGKCVKWKVSEIGGTTWTSWTSRVLGDFYATHAIIFVVPVSAIDQFLEDDPRTNRLDNSYQLFRQLCSTLRVFGFVELVVLFSKIDILKAKLDGGLRIQKYITSFGERANDYNTFIGYLKTHFRQEYRKSTTNARARQLAIHLTNLTNVQETRKIIGTIQDSISQSHINSMNVI